MSNPLVLSKLTHAWLIDVDGCVLQHNGHLAGADLLLPGVNEFWARIPAGDVIILMSARTENYAASTAQMLSKFGLRYNHLICGLPNGERILINDSKPSGLAMAHSINIARDVGLGDIFFESNPYI